MLAEQGAARLGHRLDVQRSTMTQDVTAQRVMDGRTIGDPVTVAAPQRAETGIEARGDLADDVDDDVRGQHSGQTGHQGIGGAAVRSAGQGRQHVAGHIEVAHLTARMDSGIGAPGDGEPQLGAGDLRESPLQLALHGALTGLRGPAVEIRAVV